MSTPTQRQRASSASLGSDDDDMLRATASTATYVPPSSALFQRSVTSALYSAVTTVSSVIASAFTGVPVRVRASVGVQQGGVRASWAPLSTPRTSHGASSLWTAASATLMLSDECAPTQSDEQQRESFNFDATNASVRDETKANLPLTEFRKEMPPSLREELSTDGSRPASTTMLDEQKWHTDVAQSTSNVPSGREYNLRRTTKVVDKRFIKTHRLLPIARGGRRRAAKETSTTTTAAEPTRIPINVLSTVSDESQPNTSRASTLRMFQETSQAIAQRQDAAIRAIEQQVVQLVVSTDEANDEVNKRVDAAVGEIRQLVGQSSDKATKQNDELKTLMQQALNVFATSQVQHRAAADTVRREIDALREDVEDLRDALRQESEARSDTSEIDEEARRAQDERNRLEADSQVRFEAQERYLREVREENAKLEALIRQREEALRQQQELGRSREVPIVVLPTESTNRRRAANDEGAPQLKRATRAREVHEMLAGEEVIFPTAMCTDASSMQPLVQAPPLTSGGTPFYAFTTEAMGVYFREAIGSFVRQQVSGLITKPTTTTREKPELPPLSELLAAPREVECVPFKKHADVTTVTSTSTVMTPSVINLVTTASPAVISVPAVTSHVFDLIASGPSTSVPVKAEKEPSASLPLMKDVKLPRFDGNQSVEHYLSQFEVAAVACGWSDEKKAAMLTTLLEGKALRLLPAGGMALSYSSLCKKLRHQFGSEANPAIWQARLKSRVRRENEGIHELVHAVTELSAYAYPTIAEATREELCIEPFISALTDEAQRQFLRQSLPKTLESAAELAIAYETGRKIEARLTPNTSPRRPVRRVQLSETSGEESERDEPVRSRKKGRTARQRRQRSDSSAERAPRVAPVMVKDARQERESTGSRTKELETCMAPLIKQMSQLAAEVTALKNSRPAPAQGRQSNSERRVSWNDRNNSSGDERRQYPNRNQRGQEGARGRNADNRPQRESRYENTGCWHCGDPSHWQGNCPERFGEHQAPRRSENQSGRSPSGNDSGPPSARQ